MAAILQLPVHPLPRFFSPCCPRLPLTTPSYHFSVRSCQDTDPPPPPSPLTPPPLPQPQKQSLFTSLTDALDFSQVRSEEDAQLLQDARSATQLGEKMSAEQYGALRRKIGGTYRDFFKDSVEVDGEYVDEGWIDKTCRFCKKDTASEARSVDKFGRYAHVVCLEKASKGNFFTRLFQK